MSAAYKDGGIRVGKRVLDLRVGAGTLILGRVQNLETQNGMGQGDSKTRKERAPGLARFYYGIISLDLMINQIMYFPPLDWNFFQSQSS